MFTPAYIPKSIDEKFLLEDLFPVSEAEIVANFPQGTQLKHLYTVEFHSRGKIVNGCHFNERSYMSGLFGEDLADVTMIVAYDLGAADETGDTLAEFEKNWIG